jgi:hypothetical protein
MQALLSFALVKVECLNCVVQLGAAFFMRQLRLAHFLIRKEIKNGRLQEYVL